MNRRSSRHWLAAGPTTVALMVWVWGGARAFAQQPPQRPRVDHLALENGVRIVLERTERAGPIAVAVAVRDPAVSAGAPDLAAIARSDAAPWGELAGRERGVLFAGRGVRSHDSVTGLATLRTLLVPGDELPLALHLAAQTLREAGWDEPTSQRASAQQTPLEAPRAFFVARDRLFPGSASQVPGNVPSTLDQLRALERARIRRETVVSVVGDFDIDRAAELVHQYLDSASRRPLAAALSAAPSTPPLRGASGSPSAAPIVSRVFAVTLAVRLEGDPARRRALRTAFDVLSRSRLRGLRDSASTLTVNELDEPTAGARLVGVRFVTADAVTLKASVATLLSAMTKLVAEGPTPAELTAASARLAIRDELATLSPTLRASDLALEELGGERFSAPVSLPPDAIRAALVDAFSDARCITLTEQPLP